MADDTTRLEPKVWLQFLRDTELAIVRFPEIRLNYLLDPTIPVAIIPVEGSPEVFEPNVRFSRQKDTAFLHALVPVRIRCNADDETDRLALEMNLTCQLIYQVSPEQSEPSAVILTQFKRQAVFNLWPFLRQLVDDLLLKAGIRAPLLPLLLSPPQYATADPVTPKSPSPHQRKKRL